MTLSTGKNGRYRYYACSIRARQGDTGCTGRAIPMDKLDRMVVTHIEQRLLDPERIEDVLASLLDRRQEGVERRSQHIAELNHRAAEADNRLYDAIEAGSLDLPNRPFASALRAYGAKGTGAGRRQADRSHAHKFHPPASHGSSRAGIGERSTHPTPAWKGRVSAGTRPDLRAARRDRR